jgi:hypothetical protein
LVEHLTFNQRVEGSNPSWLTILNINHAGVAELADALDLGSSAFGRGGSSPFTRIKPFGFIETEKCLRSMRSWRNGRRARLRA